MMKRKKNCVVISPFILLMMLVLPPSGVSAQNKNELAQIRSTLNDYIEGTANGEPDRLRRAFHPDFKLYTVSNDDSLVIRSGAKYIDLFTPGKKTNRTGKILSIDFEQNVAIAKAEIIMPNQKVFIDYFLLLKYGGRWKIVQKGYAVKP